MAVAQIDKFISLKTDKTKVVPLFRQANAPLIMVEVQGKSKPYHVDVLEKDLNIPDDIDEIMKYNRDLRDMKLIQSKRAEEKKTTYIMPEPLKDDEVREWDDDKRMLVVRKRKDRTGARGDNYELNQELKEAQELCGDSEIAEIVKGVVKIRMRRKKKGNPILKAALKKAKAECADDEVAEIVNGEVITREKKTRGGGSHLRGPNYELNQELIKVKAACADDETAEIIKGEIVKRKKKRKGGGRARGPDYELNQELIRVKKTLPDDKVAEIIDGEIILRDKKPRGGRVAKNPKLNEKLKKAIKGLKSNQIAEIVNGKVIVREKKRRGRPKKK